MTSLRVSRFLVIATYALTVVINALATLLPINGVTPDEVSDKYDTLFAPIGFTFAIWGVIYLSLGVYLVFQLVADNEVIRTVTPWFITGNLLNSAWIFAWHYEVLWLSLILIVGLLITLIKINQATTKARVDWGNTVAVRFPFAVYFGWVTVATVANASATLVQFGFQGGFILSATGWTIAILIVAALIGIWVSQVNVAPVYALVPVWAFYGILSRHLSPEEWNGAYPEIILALQILLPILAINAVVAAVRFFRLPKTELPTTAVWGRVTARDRVSAS